MNVSYEYFMIGGLLFIGFFLLFLWIAKKDSLGKWMKSRIGQMDESTRQRLLEERKRLTEGTAGGSVWHKAEKMLYYSGLKWKIPFLTVEMWIVFNVCLVVAAFFLGLTVFENGRAVIFPCLFLFGEYALVKAKMGQINRRVNDDLPKLLDFLGNYSATNGEICAIFQQIAKYMEEPLSNALEEFCHEAAFTGDTGLALLGMREKIEHPQFKALVNELEINMRYCADYTVLVQSSRRSLRDYMKAAGERGGMLREAVVNASLLFFMSFVSLIVVNSLIDESIWRILVMTLPGRMALSMIAVILILFAGKISKNCG